MRVYFSDDYKTFTIDDMDGRKIIIEYDAYNKEFNTLIRWKNGDLIDLPENIELSSNGKLTQLDGETFSVDNLFSHVRLTA